MIERMRRLLRRKFVQDTLALQIGKISATGLTLVSSVIVARALGPEAFGTWALARSFLAIWRTFDLTGVALSTRTRMGVAIGAKDEDEILNLLGFFVKVTVAWAAISIVILALFGRAIAARLYDGEAHIGTLVAILALLLLTERLFEMVRITLQSRRSMRLAAALQNVNVFVLTVVNIVAVVISPTAEAMVAARIVYSTITLFIAWGVYTHQRDYDGVTYPTLTAIFKRARTVAVRPYWRFGFSLALDKNLVALYTQLPLQFVGIFVGKEAAGFLQLAINGLGQLRILTSAIFDNVQAVVPQAVGRGDYVRLQHNFRQIMLVLAGGAIVFYAGWALFAPLLVPLVYGDAWRPAIPLMVVLAIYGAVTTIGAVLGPLYRAFEMMRPILMIKALSLLLMALPGLVLVNEFGARGGAWMMNGIFTLSVTLTAIVTLSVLARQARQSAPPDAARN